jgi:hypothetical protein
MSADEFALKYLRSYPDYKTAFPLDLTEPGLNQTKENNSTYQRLIILHQTIVALYKSGITVVPYDNRWSGNLLRRGKDVDASKASVNAYNKVFNEEFNKKTLVNERKNAERKGPSALRNKIYQQTKNIDELIKKSKLEIFKNTDSSYEVMAKNNSKNLLFFTPILNKDNILVICSEDHILTPKGEFAQLKKDNSQSVTTMIWDGRSHEELSWEIKNRRFHYKEVPDFVLNRDKGQLEKF